LQLYSRGGAGNEKLQVVSRMLIAVKQGEERTENQKPL
jgi:hypothetical protein